MKIRVLPMLSENHPFSDSESEYSPDNEQNLCD